MTIDVHPSELAYAFAFARATTVIGWRSELFRPSASADVGAKDWLTFGEARLTAEGRLIDTPGKGLNFTDDMASAILAIVNPGIVLLAQRKADDGVRTMTVHVVDDDLIGLTRNTGGMFEMERYADLSAAAAACASFVGAALAPMETEARIETDRERLSGLKRLAHDGLADDAVVELTALGLSAAAGRSAFAALSTPSASGVLSVLYCRNNNVEDAEAFSVITNGMDQTWIMFQPGSLDGPIILERSSAAALAARVAVGVVARLGLVV